MRQDYKPHPDDVRPLHIWAGQDPCPSVAELRRLFRLTRTQARITQMLVARRTNYEIGLALNIKITTARRHVEAVMFRVGVSSRWHVEDRIREARSQSLPITRRNVVQLVKDGGWSHASGNR